jgi:K+-sensing histidine kinase KdpD
MPSLRIFLRLGLVCVWVGAGVLLAYLSTVVDAAAQYLVFLPVIVVCSRTYGEREGVLAAILSTIALWAWFVPPDGLAPPDRKDILHLLAFFAVASFVAWVVSKERRSIAELTGENLALGHKVLLMRSLRTGAHS